METSQFKENLEKMLLIYYENKVYIFSNLKINGYAIIVIIANRTCVQTYVQSVIHTEPVLHRQYTCMAVINTRT